MKKRNRKGLELTRSISAVLLSIGMVLQPMVPAMSPLVTIHADPGDPGDNGGTGVTPAPTPSESTEPAPTPTPSVSPTPDSSATPTATPEETEPAVTIGDLSWDEANNNLTITVNGETSQVNTIKAYYYQDDVTDQKGNNHYFEMTKLNGNTWSVPFHGTSDSKTRSTYHFYKFDLLSATNSVVKSFDDKTQDILSDKTEATISYNYDADAANPLTAKVNISHLWNYDPNKEDEINSYTLSFYEADNPNPVGSIEGNFTHINNSGEPITGEETALDISSFVESHAATGGTYTAKLTYGDTTYDVTPVDENNLTIKQAPYILNTSYDDLTASARTINHSVTVNVTLNEALQENTVKLVLGDNNDPITPIETYNSSKYTFKIDTDGTYDTRNFKLEGKDIYDTPVQANNRNFVDNSLYPKFTIDKTTPEITNINVINTKDKSKLEPSTDGTYVTTKNSEGEKGFTVTVTTSEKLSDEGLTIKYKLNDVDKQLNVTSDSDDPTSYSFSFSDSGVYSNFQFDNITDENGKKVPAGKDDAGNEVKLTDGWENFGSNVYRIDDAAPSITWDNIYINDDTKNNVKDNPNINFGKKVQYQITVKDNDFGSGLQMNEDGKLPLIQYAVSTKTESTVNNGTEWKTPDKIEPNGNGSYRVIITAANRVNKIFVKAEDILGNEATSDYTKPVVIESNEPKTLNVKVTDDNKLTDIVNDSHDISFTAEDDTTNDYSGINKIEFSLGNKKENKAVDLSGNRLALVSGDNAKLNVDENDPTTATISRNTDPQNISDLDNYKSLISTVKLNAKSDRDNVVLDGEYVLHVTAYDYCGNVKKVDVENICFDTKAPTISLKFNKAVTKSQDQTYYYYNKNSDTSFTVNVSDEDGSGLADGSSKLTIKRYDNQDNVTQTVEETIAGSYSGDLASLINEDGKITIEVSAVDKAGNAQNTFTANDGIALSNDNTVGTVFLDRKAADITVSMDAPVNRTTNYHNASNAKLTVTVNDESSGLAEKTSVLTLVGKDATDKNKERKVTENFTGELKNFDIAGQGFADGEITISVTSTDKAGNVQNTYTVTENSGITLKGDKTSGTIFLDRQAPDITVSMNTPATAYKENDIDHYYYNGHNAIFTVKVTDAEASSKLATDSSLLTVSGTGTDAKPLTVTKNFKGELKDFDISKQGFADGEIKISVTAKDQAGNGQNKFATTGTTLENDNTESSIVYDTTAPVARVTYGPTDHKEDDAVLYNADLVDTKHQSYATVAIDDTNFDENKITVKPTHDAAVAVDASAKTYTVSFSNDGLYHLGIYGTDKAGNPVVVEEQNITKNSSDGFRDPIDSKDSDENYISKNVETKTDIVVDKVSPVVTISYNNPSNAAYAETDEHALYYGIDGKDSQSVSFSFVDTHVGKYDLEKDDLHVYQTKDSNTNTKKTIDVKESEDTNKSSESRKFEGSISVGGDKSDEGSYVYSFDGSQDRAGNPVQVVETYTGGSTSTASDTAQYHIVVDNTNPVASVAVDPSHTTFDGRDYYGKAQGDIHAKFTVKEANFDGSLIHYGTGTVGKETGKYTDDTVKWTEPGTELSTADPNDPNAFTGDITPINADGVYKLEIAGTDKAKNPIVADGATGQNELHKHGNTDGELWTNEKVRDTVIQGNLKVSNESGNAYFTVDIPNNSAKADELFRKENKAEVNADAVDEKSPYRIEYVLNSSLQDANISQTTGNDYKYDNSLKYTVDGEQRFNVVSAKIVDVAGNEATLDSSQSNQTNIYLDVSQPVADDINRPVASIQAHATSNITARTADGRDLYANNVELNFNITDPNHNGKITSSGLKGVYYTIKADGVVVQQQTDAEENLKNSSQYTWSTKPGQIVVGNDTNNIEVEFWGVDNAGNESNHAKYSFGIDKTGPKITVNYDNNDAQHDKYFKANRTATVTVQDRNIDFSKINIKTQVGHSNLSAAVANGSGVGNNDTRTFTIPYTQDGDYTLEITGTDAVNNVANVDYVGNGNAAPRDFTIDKTIPVIKVSFDNNDVENGKYYKAARTATINVNEHNFLGNEVKVDQTATIQRGTTSVPGVSGFSTGSDSHNATIRYNQDGNYTLTVNYTDMAGNQAAPVTVSEFTIDQTAPVVKIDGVKNNAAYNGEVMPTVTIDDTNFSEDLASFVLNGIKIKDRSNLLTSRVVNEFGATIRFENIAAVKDNDDVYTATAVVTDLAGNVTKTQVRFSVNRFGSTYDYGDTATKSLMTKYFDKKTGSVLINEINVNQLHDQKVYLNFNGGTEELEEGKDYKITVSQMEDGSGYKYTYEIFSSVFKKQGTYSITVQSVDEAGNINTNATVKEGNDVVDVPFEFAIDTTNPVITSTENLEPDVLWTKTHDAEHTFSFTTTDNMSISKLTYAVTDAEGNPIGKEETLDADQLKSVNGMVSVDLRSANTNQYIKLTAVDAAGNTLTAMYSIYMNANALSRAWHFYWYVFLLIGAGIAVLIFFLVRNSKNKKKAA